MKVEADAVVRVVTTANGKKQDKDDIPEPVVKITVEIPISTLDSAQLGRLIQLKDIPVHWAIESFQGAMEIRENELVVAR